jgi:hypothetical protein
VPIVYGGRNDPTFVNRLYESSVRNDDLRRKGPRVIPDGAHERGSSLEFKGAGIRNAIFAHVTVSAAAPGALVGLVLKAARKRWSSITNASSHCYIISLISRTAAPGCSPSISTGTGPGTAVNQDGSQERDRWGNVFEEIIRNITAPLESASAQTSLFYSLTTSAIGKDCVQASICPAIDRFQRTFSPEMLAVELLLLLTADAYDDSNLPLNSFDCGGLDR